MDRILNFTAPFPGVVASTATNKSRTADLSGVAGSQLALRPAPPPPRPSARPNTSSTSVPSVAMQETNRTLELVFQRLAQLDEYCEVEAQARRRAMRHAGSDVAIITTATSGPVLHSQPPRGVGRPSASHSATTNEMDESEEVLQKAAAERNLRLSARERQKELECRFEELYRNPHSHFRSRRGLLSAAAAAEQPAFGRSITRAPLPRTPQERRRGREIQQANIEAVRSPSPVHRHHGGGQVVSPTARLRDSNTNATTTEEQTSAALRPLSSSPPRDADERARLRAVAAHVSKELDAHRGALETKWDRLATLDPVVIRRRTVPRDEDTIQLILRVCAWHVNATHVRFATVIGAFAADRRGTRAARAAVLQRSWNVLIRSLYPAVRRWVRRMRLRRFYRWLRCALFVVKLQRRHRCRCVSRIVPFLRNVAKDRSMAIRRFCTFLRRSVFLVQSAFARQRARHRLLAQQWTAMETSLLLFHQPQFPDMALIPGWRDEHAAVRLKLLNCWSRIERHERSGVPSAGPGREETSRSVDSSYISSAKSGSEGTAEVAAHHHHLPAYLQETLCWRQFYVKHRPVGVFEEGVLDRLPRSLALFRASPQRRTELIRQYKDAEYRFHRKKALDASIALQRRLRNLEEWRERQRVEVIHRAKNEYHISPDSQLFDIVCDYEMKRRERDMATVTNLNKQRGRRRDDETKGGTSSSPPQSPAGTSSLSAATPYAPEYLIPEHALRDLAAQEIRATIQRMRRQRGSLAL